MLSDYNGTGGTGVLNAAAAAPPVNDDFANAITVNTVGFGDTRTTTGATGEVGEPLPACTSQQAASTHSVWYRYTPGSSGTAVFNTNGSSTDSIIQTVTGSLGGFAAVTGGCSDTGGQGVGETVTFSVTSGTNYFIMVSDWNGVGGTSVLNFTSGPAPAIRRHSRFDHHEISFRKFHPRASWRNLHNHRDEQRHRCDNRNSNRSGYTSDWTNCNGVIRNRMDVHTWNFNLHAQ